MAAQERPVILILGPTAGGKTAFSLVLSHRLPGGGEILSADSMQVYRGMDIGTAKPTADERQAVPHHLIDVVEPDQPFTVEDWLRLTEEVIADIRTRGRWPIMVGGTNLYVKVFLEGMFSGPPADEAYRAELAARPTEDLHRELAAVDPAATARIHVNDRKRLTRALEVHRSTGRPISELQEQWDRGSFRPDTLVIGLEWPHDEINRRINARVREMLAEGFAEEARSLWSAGRLGPQAREALGYRQLVDHFEGRLTLDEAVERIKIETRRFARKQRTWLKRFRAHPRSLWIEASGQDAQTIVAQGLAFTLRISGFDPV